MGAPQTTDLPPPELGAGTVGVPTWSGHARPVAWIRLPQKTTAILLVLLIAVVGMVGCVFFFCTRSMLQDSQREQLSAFAYGVAATLGESGSGQSTTQIEFGALDKTPNLEFIVLTDPTDRQVAALITEPTAWTGFRNLLASTGVKSRLLGQIQAVTHGDRASNTITVPVFEINENGQPAGLFGYLHCGFSDRCR